MATKKNQVMVRFDDQNYESIMSIVKMRYLGNSPAEVIRWLVKRYAKDIMKDMIERKKTENELKDLIEE